ncbi:dienelactone hydrolase family protein [Streptomyces marispadix]|uniref:Dienelactone hydrolase family protein n=1 Tax=Streptomyces marispadix TaxID=2922868 RepID=A0ABS9T684_9ACTN|nr:alpha/beta family hydrolase [Streptomyces marispadix]MCH6158864.1 dienelactone hydrolase family protein [Streptomyces marispadix]MCH6158870.1 dienelactone hydrolase family protein [Streptomyces marispadix]MCH6164042.1 dienelactone hydrolase family protein [Streptomyces marispadix]
MISEQISVAVPGNVDLPGDLDMPPSPRGMVLFVHGSGSSRHSPRNRAVAAELQRHGWGTLLIDLLSEDEEKTDAATGQHRFDIALLSERTATAIEWLSKYPVTHGVPVHLFGASTGAAAALVAAAQAGPVVSVVSRGGRPDLAGDALKQVEVPVLLLVGGRDPQVLELNQEAAQLLPADHQLQVIPGATHLFEEPGALEQVAAAAREWFLNTAEAHAEGHHLP